MYSAIPGDGKEAASVVMVEGAPERQRAVLPVLGGSGPQTEVTIGVVGRPGFRKRLGSTLRQMPLVTVSIDREGPVTSNLLAGNPDVEVMMVDGESGHHLALRAPTLNRDDVLAQIPVILLVDPAAFEPPNEVAVVIGRRWSVLLTTTAENPLRLRRAIQKAAAGKTTLDAGVDNSLIRTEDDLSALRRAPKF